MGRSSTATAGADEAERAALDLMARNLPVRSEAEVAADTAMALLQGGLLVKNRPQAELIATIAEVALIPVPEMRGAWHRWEDRGRRFEGTGPRPTIPSEPSPARPPEGEHRPAPAPSPAAPPAAKRTVPASLDGSVVAGLAWMGEQLERDGVDLAGPPEHQRHHHRGPRRNEKAKLCLGCRRTKPATRFRIVNATTGRRSPSCIPCEDSPRDRTLDVKRERPTNAVRLGFMLHACDDLDGVACVGCQIKLGAGDLVFGVTTLHHEACPEWHPPKLVTPAPFTRRDR